MCNVLCKFVAVRSKQPSRLFVHRLAAAAAAVDGNGDDADDC